MPTRILLSCAGRKISTQCANEQTRRSQQPILGLDEAREPPKQDVTSRATGMAAQPQFRVYEKQELPMNNIVYIVGAVVIVLVILSVLGFR